ncbi:hypothetical protein RD792_008145, partial [Penstemon davidsonii]
QHDGLLCSNPGPIEDFILYYPDMYVSAAVLKGQLRVRERYEDISYDFREMTVKLEDVADLLELPINAPDSGYRSGGMVKLSWLKEAFSEFSEHAAVKMLSSILSAYLLYLVGSTIFSTTTGNKVPTRPSPTEPATGHEGGVAGGARLEMDFGVVGKRAKGGGGG